MRIYQRHDTSRLTDIINNILFVNMTATIPRNQRPLYAQVTKALLNDIRQNHRPGDLLPTQQEFADRYDTSLITVKRAIGEISRMGLIESVRGRGTIVRRPTVIDAHTGVSSWTDNMRGMGVSPKTAWSRINIESPTKQIQRLLGMKAGEPAIVIRRLRTLKGIPVCLMANHLPASCVPGLEITGLDQESLYAVLEDRYGIKFKHADEEVAAREANEPESDVFGRDCGPVLEIKRTSFDAHDQPVEFAVLTAPASRYTYRVQIYSKPGASSAC